MESREMSLMPAYANPLAVMTMPDDLAARLAFGAKVTAELQDCFRHKLTPEDLAIWDSEKPWSSIVTKKISDLWNDTIIEFAQTYGWRVYLSRDVLEQIAHWHDRHEDGLNCIRRLGEAVYLAAQVAHGENTLPVTNPELRAIKPQAVNELRRLLKQSRKAFNQRRTPWSDQEVCKWLRNTVEASPKAFPFWSVNIPSLLQYFERAKKRDGALLQRIALGNVGPASLFDEWGADVHNLSTHTFRVYVSRLPAPKKL